MGRCGKLRMQRAWYRGSVNYGGEPSPSNRRKQAFFGVTCAAMPCIFPGRAHPGATPAAYAEVPGVLRAIARYGASRAGVPLQSVLLLTSKEARGHGRIGFVRYRKHVAADARRSAGCPEQR